MKAQDILNEVYGTQTQDPQAAQLAAMMAEVTQAFQAQQVSREEYLELIKDFQAQQLINAQCKDLAAKERLNNIINVVINAAMLLSSV